MTKFNVGDTIRISGMGAGGLAIGTLAKVVRADHDGDVWLESGEFYLKHNVELAPSTDDRLTEAEAKIAALEAEVETMKAKESGVDIDNFARVLSARMASEVSIPRGHAKPGFMWELAKASLTPNQRRADVIKRAQAFANEGYDRWFGDRLCYVEFFVNSDKRTVVAVLRGKYSSGLIAKGIAKCAPDDVFNADIGKAIALGRALGVKVSKEFTDAPKPTEFAVGQVTKTPLGRIHKIVRIDGDKARTNPGTFHHKSEFPIITVTDDTEAQY